jgi:solute carrier family 25 carnitine/acylcarnitine transporter 20/29
VKNPDTSARNNDAIERSQPAKGALAKNYKGFAAGVFSGVAKLSVGHPFDTIKVRLQTSQKAQFQGPLDCLLQTIRNEGFRGLYKGATPPLLGWMAMDSIMLGSLTLYRRLLLENIFGHRSLRPGVALEKLNEVTLPSFGHGIAGILAGWTVSFIAAPVEHVKARLQTQYAAKKSDRLYRGPIDCTKKLLQAHGFRGLFHGLGATLIFRSFFFFWWGSYDILTRVLQRNTSLSTPSINFWAGGLSAQVFWLTSYPSDVVKQRIMTDPLGGRLNDGQRKFRNWREAAWAVGREAGLKGYWRGFVPCFLRAFPANAMALVAFEAAMRTLPG